MAVHKSSPTLVGRDRELDRLGQSWAVTRTTGRLTIQTRAGDDEHV